MSFKDFVKQKILITFFITSTCIGGAMAVLGMIFEPDTRMGYEGFLFPIFLGVLTILPQFIMYSKKEFTVREALVRKVIRLLLIEAEILLVIYVGGGYQDPAIAFSLILTVLIIAIVVELVLYLNDTSTARQFNMALKELQSRS